MDVAPELVYYYKPYYNTKLIKTQKYCCIQYYTICIIFFGKLKMELSKGSVYKMFNTTKVTSRSVIAFRIENFKILDQHSHLL